MVLKAIPIPTAPVREEDARVRFVLQLGAALHRYGTPAHWLESVMVAVSERLGLTARFFSTPTAIFASFGPADALKTTLIRADPGELDLDRLSRLNALTTAVLERRQSPSDGADQIEKILAAPPLYGPLVTVLCYGLAAATGAQLFGGGFKELWVSGLIGLFLGGLAVLAGRYGGVARVFEPLAAFGASALSVLGTRVFGYYSTELTTLAALIFLLPGLVLTLAMTELATRNLVSGTSRFTGAAVIFLMLIFGAALGRRIDVLLPPGPPVSALAELPAWTLVPSLGIITLALAVLFKAALRDCGWILLAGALAYGGSRLGALLLGPELGAFLGALLLGAGSNAVARAFDRPAVVMLIPGIMLLVPGSLGFRSLESLLHQDVLTGVETAFSMALVAVALVAGLLVANTVVQPRRAEL